MLDREQLYEWITLALIHTHHAYQAVWPPCIQYKKNQNSFSFSLARSCVVVEESHELCNLFFQTQIQFVIQPKKNISTILKPCPNLSGRATLIRAAIYHGGKICGLRRETIGRRSMRPERRERRSRSAIVPHLNGFAVAELSEIAGMQEVSFSHVRANKT